MRRGKSEQRLVERAKILLLADEGHTNQQIARPEDPNGAGFEVAPALLRQAPNWLE